MWEAASLCGPLVPRSRRLNRWIVFWCCDRQLPSWSMFSVFFFVVLIPPSVLRLPSAGRCASCGENVVGEGTGCTAMDQVFHVDCFVCMTCNTKLRGKPFFAVEKKAYCEPCYIVSSFWSWTLPGSAVFVFVRVPWSLEAPFSYKE